RDVVDLDAVDHDPAIGEARRALLDGDDLVDQLRDLAEQLDRRDLARRLADPGTDLRGDVLDRVLDREPPLGLAGEVTGDAELDREPSQVRRLELEAVAHAAVTDPQKAGRDGLAAGLVRALGQVERGQLLVVAEQLARGTDDHSPAVTRGDQRRVVGGYVDRQRPRRLDLALALAVRLGGADPQVPVLGRNPTQDVLLL